MARTSSFRVLPALLGAVLVSLGAIGCASNEDYTALKMDRDNLAEQLAAARRDAEGNRRLAEGYREQLATISAGGAAENAQLLNLQQQVMALTGERDDLMNKYQELLQKIGTGPALPAVLTNELTTFAEANPGLVTFDANAGIVKFKSDVTFASGDAELTTDAKAVLGKFAAILNGPIAKNYRLEIAGHTDNVPVESGLTISKGHKDNWYLSSHRAISVAKALMSQGVVQSRIGVTGYADQKPVASNTDAGGRQQNRRVEVLILPTTVSGAAETPTAQAPAVPEAEPAAAVDEGVSK
jgi:chemotaxis protein MotB